MQSKRSYKQDSPLSVANQVTSIVGVILIGFPSLYLTWCNYRQSDRRLETGDIHSQTKGGSGGLPQSERPQFVPKKKKLGLPLTSVDDLWKKTQACEKIGDFVAAKSNLQRIVSLQPSNINWSKELADVCGSECQRQWHHSKVIDRSSFNDWSEALRHVKSLQIAAHRIGEAKKTQHYIDAIHVGCNQHKEVLK